MKKLLLTFVIGTSIATNAQEHVFGFEDLTLPTIDTFYNGEDNSGGFTSISAFNQLTFSNDYTVSQWGDYWNGFSYSNMTNNQTPGYANQYSAFPGVGAMNSDNYGVFYPEGAITLQTPMRVDSIMLSNTTYAALSMLNGDMFGKKFGDTLNASGDVDGTNGEDFFRLWVYKVNSNEDKVDSVLFYLADYRFSNNSDDYVLSSWKSLDLGSFGLVEKLSFKLESSDMSSGFINTPQYFALDNIYLSAPLSIGNIMSNNIRLFPNPCKDILYIKNITQSFQTFKILNTIGNVVLEQEFSDEINISELKNGTYFLLLNDEILKPFVKL